MFVSTRDESREFFLRVRARMSGPTLLEPLEQVVAGVIAAHPEYHALLDDPARVRQVDFDEGVDPHNPFMHMGLHIALIEQLQTDRPAGVRAVYQQLLPRSGGDNHATDHQMMACLGDALWRARDSGAPPDEQAYLAALSALLR